MKNKRNIEIFEKIQKEKRNYTDCISNNDYCPYHFGIN